MQLASAVSSIANGGNLMKPYLVERILDDSGQEVQKFEPQVVRRVVSPETASKVVRMMETVTTQGGTGTKAAVEGFRVAGKTGTAQKVDAVTRSYGSKRTASFVGFIPADKPKLTIVVIVDEPQGSKYGGVVAAPAFRMIAMNSLAYLKISPQGETRTTAQTAAATTIAPQQQQEAVTEGGSIDAALDGEGEIMPNFQGMSMRRVLQVMEKKNINIRLMGSGRAMEQNPPPGHKIRGVGEVWIKFAPSA
jgi:cell division protein FtsI (penicillin-binding protein 3)